MAAQGFSMVFKDDPNWKKFSNLSRFNANINREIKRATIKNSLLIIKAVGKGIKSQNFAQNSPLTLALSKGSKALLKEKNLLDALSFKLSSSFRSEVGFFANAQSTGGTTGQTIQMQKLVELMESGYTITVTPKMIMAIMASLNNVRTKKGNLTGRARKAIKAIQAGEGGGGKRTWRVPPRKFMTEVLTDSVLSKQIRQNWSEALEKVWRLQGVTGGEDKEKAPKT